VDTELLNGAQTSFPKIDVMICEATYGDREHPSRQKEVKRFLDTVQDTVSFGGSVIIPAFAVGRAQEVLLMLAKRDFGVPVYLDGMAKKVTQLYLRHGRYLKSAEAMQDAFSRAAPVSGWRDRKDIVKQRAIVVTTSGMMDGGPVIDYMRHHYFDTKNAVLLTGYQAEGCNGRHMLETGRLRLDDEEVKVRCGVHKFDFSAHSGCEQLKRMIKNIKPKVLILQHGEERSVKNLAEWCDFCEVHTPSLDDEIEVDP
jgi:putative mRNA 3-end processing factor